MDVVNFALGVAASVLAALLYSAVQWIYGYLQEIRSPFTGEWEGRIYDTGRMNVVKKDSYRMKQRGEVLSGRISRVYPADQTHRAWRMWGRVRDQNFFAVFWSLNRGIPSYGCWYLRQLDENNFDGFYLRLHEATGNNAFGIAPVRLELVRKKPRSDKSVLLQPSAAGT